MINLISTAIVLLVPAYIVVMITYQYMTAVGTKMERLKEAFHDSATITWTRLTSLSSVLVGAVGTVASYLGAPGIQQAIEPYLQPKYMLAYMLLTLIGAEIARRRTLP